MVQSENSPEKMKVFNDLYFNMLKILNMLSPADIILYKFGSALLYSVSDNINIHQNIFIIYTDTYKHFRNPFVLY